MRKDKIIIIDLDDTLIDTSDVYWKTRNQLVKILESPKMQPNKIIDYFEINDTKNFKKYGVAPDRYKKSMLDTYKQFVDKGLTELNDETVSQIEIAGDLIQNEIPSLIEGAVELLEWIHKRYKLVLLTRGEKRLQLKKIEYHKIEQYFNKILVVNSKDSKLFKSIISELNVLPEETWIIGDSIKSEINPGTSVGANCIFYFYKHKEYLWKQEYTEIPIGSFYIVEHLPDIIKILSKPNLYPKYSNPILELL